MPAVTASLVLDATLKPLAGEDGGTLISRKSASKQAKSEEEDGNLLRPTPLLSSSSQAQRTESRSQPQLEIVAIPVEDTAATQPTNPKSSSSAAAIVVPFIVGISIFSALLGFWLLRRRRRLAQLSTKSRNTRLEPQTPGRQVKEWFTSLASPKSRATVKVVEVKNSRSHGISTAKEKHAHGNTKELVSRDLEGERKARESRKERKRPPPVIDLRAAIEAGRKAARTGTELAKAEQARQVALNDKIRATKEGHPKPKPVLSTNTALASIHRTSPIKRSSSLSQESVNPVAVNEAMSGDEWRGPPTASTASFFNTSRHLTTTSSFFCAGSPIAEEAPPLPEPPVTAIASSFFSDTSLPYRTSTVVSEGEIKRVEEVARAQAQLVVPPMPTRKRSSLGSIRGPPNTGIDVDEWDK